MSLGTRLRQCIALARSAAIARAPRLHRDALAEYVRSHGYSPDLPLLVSRCPSRGMPAEAVRVRLASSVQ